MFWIVMADQASTNVTHRHASLQDARIEAERLARKHGKRFYVLEAIGAAAAASPPINWEWVTHDVPLPTVPDVALPAVAAAPTDLDDLPF